MWYLDGDFLGPFRGEDLFHWLRINDVDSLDNLGGLLEVLWVEGLPNLIDALEVHQGVSGLELPNKGQHLLDGFSLGARASALEDMPHNKARFFFTESVLGGHFAR